MSRADAPVFVDSPDQISVAAVAAAIARNRLLIGLTALFCGVAGGVHALLRPATYSSTAWFKPQVQQAQSQTLMGLASQFGLTLPLGGSGMSPQAYADLAVSREILRPVTMSHYSYHAGSKVVSGTLVDLITPGPKPAEERRESTIAQLGKDIGTTVSKTGAVALKVSTSHPDLSQELAANIMAELDSLNVQTQQGRATPEREFVEQRVAVAEGELHQAEDRLAAFLETNRQFATPQLQLERDRLNRDVSMRQQLYTSLVQAYEAARIDEVRNIPAITILEQPEVPFGPDSRRIPSTTALAFALGIILGLFFAFLRDTWRHLRRLTSGVGPERNTPEAASVLRAARSANISGGA